MSKNSLGSELSLYLRNVSVLSDCEHPLTQRNADAQGPGHPLALTYLRMRDQPKT